MNNAGLSLVFSALVATVAGQVTCPDSWTHYGSSCYAFYNMKANFIEASSLCSSFGGSYLAEIETEGENLHIKAYMQLQNTDGVDGVWLGGNDIMSEGLWVWDKSETSIQYFDWGSGQPDDSGSKQNCMSLWKHFAFKWADHYCTDKLAFLCEQPAK
ncbi:C-type lectin mannose-binding isoform-like isoform X1 [Haliotis rufescens]|uniref:C-type lectin mannose-binding isoform-like isoform X1 n=1 Tax=Haliotis rufescens TaxID=6454 RepID=UPI001EB08363|nr:C-type lectin mannose-binding isoform-like isoform X1 [Haliotis rufescens]